MKLIKPGLSFIAFLLAGSLCIAPTAFAAGVGASVGVGADTGAGSAGVNGNSTVTTPGDPTMPATPLDPADRMDRTMNKRPNATPTNPSGNRGTNMRNKDCDVNVSANDPTRNCNDTDKPKK